MTEVMPLPDGAWNEYWRPKTCHVVAWPAAFEGCVWLHLLPGTTCGSEVGIRTTPHDFEINWGPWVWRATLDLDANGVVLKTGKAPDAWGSAPCEIRCNLPFRVTAGIEDIGATVFRSIHGEWLQRTAS